MQNMPDWRIPPGRRWGPYVSERAWGTVREDYSEHGDGLGFVPARPRPVARLPLERGRPGRHLRRPADALPGVRVLERPRPDPQGADLRPRRARRATTARTPRSTGGTRTPRRPIPGCAGATSTRRPRSRTHDWSTRTRRRGRHEPEFELLDTGIFDDDRYWDITVDYAKADADDMCIRVTRPQRRARHGRRCTCCPTLWFRNTWSWGLDDRRPSHRRRRTAALDGRAPHRSGGMVWPATARRRLLFCDNETNARAAVGRRRAGRTRRTASTITSSTAPTRSTPTGRGTKAALQVPSSTVAAGRDERADDSPAVRRRRSHRAPRSTRLCAGSAPHEADEFYAALDAAGAPVRTRPSSCARRSRGMMWAKQFYHYDVAALARRRSRAARAAGRTHARAQLRAGGTSTTTT